MRPLSIEMLRTGVIIQDDIYAHDASKLLVRKGTILSEEMRARVFLLNDNKPTVYLEGLPPPSPAEVQQEMERRRLKLEKDTGYGEVAQDTVELLADVTQKEQLEPLLLKTVSFGISNQLDNTNPSVILSLVNALAPVDEYLQRHSVNTALLNGLMGKWMELPQEAVTRLALIGLLHDVGKAMMPSSILNEQRRLTVTEFEVIKTHPIYSYDLLSDFPEDVRLAVRGHHEKMNGSGYPDKLAGDQISLESRITAISDIYDALVAQRAYKEPRSPFVTMAMLKEMGKAELDAKLVGLFTDNMPNELIDKQVLLSDGSVAHVKMVDKDDIEYPIVSLHGEEIKTCKNLYCTSMF